MKNALTLPVVLLILFVSTLAGAQELSKPIDQQTDFFERISESLTDDKENNQALEQLSDDLEWLASHPVDLNRATRDDLEKLPFLNPVLIDSFLTYRDRTGSLATLFELQLIDGFSSEILNNLAAFSVVNPVERDLKKTMAHEISTQIQHPFEKSADFCPDEEGVKKYPGPASRFLIRYKGTKDERFIWGLCAENDPGEAFFTQSNPHGFDFYSAHFTYQSSGIIKTTTLGDYRIKLGQGLCLWSGYGKRKSADQTAIRLTGQGSAPCTSTDENAFLRGLTTTLQKGRFETLLFYSNKKIDANVIELFPDSTVKTVSSLQTTGYHRSLNETEDENSLKVATAGGSLRYRHKQFSAGLNGVLDWFGAVIEPGDDLYKRFAFRGNKNYNFSSDFLWVRNHVSLFGEAAISRSGGKAFIAGMEAYPANKFNFSLLYRNYASNYHTFLGNAFSEGSSTSNEEGIYAAYAIYPFRKINFTGYIDLYRSHWMKYQSTAPVTGADFQLQSQFKVSSTLNMYFRFKTETNYEKSGLYSYIKTDVPKTISRFRYHLNWAALPWLTGRFRVEYASYQKDTSQSQGILGQADLIVHPKNQKFSGSARIAWFDTNDYNSRIYTYENDVPRNFYIPAFYGHGLRAYLQLKWQMSGLLTLFAKYGCTYDLGQDVTGSDDEQSVRPPRHELKVQLRIRL